MKIIDNNMDRNADVEMSEVYNALLNHNTSKSDHMIAWLPCIDVIYINHDWDIRTTAVSVEFNNGETIYLGHMSAATDLSRLADDYEW